MERKRYYHCSGSGFSPEVFGRQLSELIDEVKRETGKKKVIYLCIGSDRSTGDSLGPLVGHQLCGKVPNGETVVGTLKKPVHAMNLGETMEYIQCRCRNALVVAVDASVGSAEQVGTITLGRGSIRPGLGVSKKLEEVGDIYITGVVHSGNDLEPELLQSTRLSLVMELAESICAGILAHGQRAEVILPVIRAAAGLWKKIIHTETPEEDTGYAETVFTGERQDVETFCESRESV